MIAAVGSAFILAAFWIAAQQSAIGSSLSGRFRGRSRLSHCCWPPFCFSHSELQSRCHLSARRTLVS